MLLLTIAGCSRHQPPDIPAEEKNKVYNVRTEQAEPYEGLIRSSYSGLAEARKTTSLSFASMGTVTEVFVEEGQSVRQGQLLAALNAAGPRSAYDAALASRQQAEDAYRRMKPMKENGTLPEIKWVEVETGLAQARAAVAIAQKGVDDCSLYAPAAGVIGRKSVQPGMNIIPGSTALELLNIGSVYVRIPVPENEISLFKKGAPADIRINALGRSFSGAVKEIGVSADLLSHTYPVKIEVDNRNGEIKPGMICAVSLDAQDTRSGLLVSGEALQRDVHGQQFLYIVRNGIAEKIPVQTLSLTGPKILVQGGVPENASVIISGQQNLKEGDPVKVLN